MPSVGFFVGFFVGSALRFVGFSVGLFVGFSVGPRNPFVGLKSKEPGALGACFRSPFRRIPRARRARALGESAKTSHVWAAFSRREAELSRTTHVDRGRWLSPRDGCFFSDCRSLHANCRTALRWLRHCELDEKCRCDVEKQESPAMISHNTQEKNM